MKTKLLLLLLMTFSISSFSQIIKDDSYLDTDFVKFKTSLMQSVISKDEAGFAKHLASKVLIMKDVCDSPKCSKDAVIQYFFSDDNNPQSSWKSFFNTFRFGFMRVEENPKEFAFFAPSFKYNLESESKLLILGENVNIRKKPSLNAKIIKKASYEEFEYNDDSNTFSESNINVNDGYLWLEVFLKNGEKGYVVAKLTSYYYDTQIKVEKINGQWKITEIIEPIGC
ncbi:SH3 domain-containing protein [Aureivirga sp. CE67]|uniref:SH3 domain-containing protein n=1 Tax=Aureivirga sp. CE67 TaxID=1788983 RepID=UPI0018C938E3|nr:SH3 domain-containing protein [Aureivirga sp. CE67]